MTSLVRQIAFGTSFAFPLVLYIIIMGTYYTASGQAPYMINDLHRSLPYFRDQASEWTITSTFATDYVSTDCASYPLLGGVTPTSYISSFVRTYENLVPHITAITTYEVSFIDTWPSAKGFSSGYTSFQNNFLFTAGTWPSNVCGNPSQKDLISKARVTIVAPHSTSSLTVQLTPSAGTSPPQLAIRNVQVTLSNVTWTTVKAGYMATGVVYNCMTILDGATVPVTNFKCICPLNQYKPTGGSCTSCHPSCSSCYGASETECVNCNTGYTFDGTKCILCHESCETCFGTAEGQCYTCPDGYYLYSNSSCLSTCPSSYITQTAGDLYCNMTCDASCATCSGTADNQCSTCPNGYYLYPNSTCWSTCPASYRSQSSNTLSCNYVKCRADNTLNYNESAYYYYYPYEDICKETCPTPWVIVERLYDRPDCDFPLTPQEIQQVQSMSTKSSTSADVMSGGLVVAAALNPADPSGISSGTLAKQFEYTRFFDITRSPRLEIFYQVQRSSPGVVVIGSDLSNSSVAKFTYNPLLPTIFTKDHLYSSFIPNFFGSLQSLLIILGGVILVFSLEHAIIKHLNKFAEHFKKLRLAVLAFFVMQFYNAYTDLMFFGAIEFITFEGGNALDWVSFFLALICYIIAFVVLILHIRLIWRYQTIKANNKTDKGAKEFEEYQKKHSDFDMLYKEFKDLSFIQQSYLFLLTIRASLSGIFMGTLHAHPITQASLMIALSIISIIYLIFRAPFKNIFCVLQQLAYEIILLIVTITFLTMACLDANGRNSDESRYRLGELVIDSIFASKFVSLITLIPSIVQAILGVIKTLKDRKKPKEPVKANQETPSKMNSLDTDKKGTKFFPKSHNFDLDDKEAPSDKEAATSKEDHLCVESVSLIVAEEEKPESRTHRSFTTFKGIESVKSKVCLMPADA